MRPCLQSIAAFTVLVGLLTAQAGCVPERLTYRPRISGQVVDKRGGLANVRVEACSTAWLTTPEKVSFESCARRATAVTSPRGMFRLPQLRQWHRRDLLAEYTEVDRPSTTLLACGRNGKVGHAFITYKSYDQVERGRVISITVTPSNRATDPVATQCAIAQRARGRAP
jgi:hypothetical protein